MDKTTDREKDRIRMLANHLLTGDGIVTDNAFDVSQLQLVVQRGLETSSVLGKHGEILILVQLSKGDDDE